MFLSLFILFFHDGCRDFCCFSGSPDPARLLSAPQQPPVVLICPSIPPQHCSHILPHKGQSDEDNAGIHGGKAGPRGCHQIPPGPQPRGGMEPGSSQLLLRSLQRTQLQVVGCVLGTALPQGSTTGAPQTGSTAWGTLKHCLGHHTQHWVLLRGNLKAIPEGTPISGGTSQRS